MKEFSIIIITGLSGSGKSTAIHALEDAGYFCVDNLPVALLSSFLDLRAGSGSGEQKIALGMDIREREFVETYSRAFEELRSKGYHPNVVFLEASDEILLKRFSQTRRQHPVRGGSLLESIRLERAQIHGLKEHADKVIDTSQLTAHELKAQIMQYARRGVRTERVRIGIVSFGFKYGIPPEADMIIDVRFIPNPYFVAELQSLDGRDPTVHAFVRKWPETEAFLERYLSLLDFLIPLYEKEGKSYLNIGVGCTGGRHRSIVIAEEIFRHLNTNNRHVTLSHRDLELAQEIKV
jgi:UPF0042 nucleotide-binding protein